MTVSVEGPFRDGARRGVVTSPESNGVTFPLDALVWLPKCSGTMFTWTVTSCY